MDQVDAFLNWVYSSHGKTTEELKETLVYTTLELEQTKMLAQEELSKKDYQLIHLEDVLTKTLQERDVALEKCHRLHLDNLSLQKQISNDQVQPPPPPPQSSSDSEESIMSPSVIDPMTDQKSQGAEIMATLLSEKPLPEKGNLLQAVLKAGPLLQTLLLAGPLPQWRHPPPPVIVPPPQFQSPIVNKKRAFESVDGSYSETKYPNAKPGC